MLDGICSVEGCGRPTRARDLCNKHYLRSRAHGDPTITLRAGTEWGSVEKHPIYNVYSNMKRKSGKKNAPLVCAEWQSDFRKFLEDVGERPSPTHMLKLIDAHAPYNKENVRWEERLIKVENTTSIKEYRKLYAREYRKNNPANSKHTMLKKEYGITLDQFGAMHDGQYGLCKICGKPETSIIRGRVLSLAVDHDYTTGKIRGLLCHHCNKALGGFKDSTALLKSAIIYLEAHKP